jgi:hypothetical protein
MQNLVKHTVNVLHHVVIPKSQNEITGIHQVLRSLFILLHTICMLPAIDLQDELCIGTAKIHNEAIERHLSPEFPSTKPTVTQAEPQHPFRIGLMSA